MGDPEKVDDDATLGAPSAPSQAAEPQSAEPPTPEQPEPLPVPEATKPQPADPLAAEQPRPASVRYQVLAPVFVNGSVVDPKGRKDVYVSAVPGLEGRALKLAPEKTPA